MRLASALGTGEVSRMSGAALCDDAGELLRMRSPCTSLTMILLAQDGFELASTFPNPSPAFPTTARRHRFKSIGKRYITASSPNAAARPPPTPKSGATRSAGRSASSARRRCSLYQTRARTTSSPGVRRSTRSNPSWPGVSSSTKGSECSLNDGNATRQARGARRSSSAFGRTPSWRSTIARWLACSRTLGLTGRSWDCGGGGWACRWKGTRRSCARKRRRSRASRA